jgi:zinc/manganese transport system substrate-binding protein
MRWVGIISVGLIAALVAGCGRSGAPAGDGGGRLQIVAAENFWGSIAAQLAGSRGQVTSIITSPAQDPHDYEPTVADARHVAAARLAIVNGVGYDRWASELLSASPAAGRITLSVGSLLHLAEGDNPHRWYNPADVEAVAVQITRDLARIDPRDAAYFKRRHASFEHAALAGYHAAIAGIRGRFAGTPVGASESIFAALAPSLGLRLITPNGFMNAVSEGTDLSARDTIVAERQITRRQISVWVYNEQNVTPEIARLNGLAKANRIPISTISETLAPPTASFEQWQTQQLARLARALHAATGR